MDEPTEADLDPTAIELERVGDDEYSPLKQRFRGYAIHGNMPFDVPYLTEVVRAGGGLWQGGTAGDLVLPDWIRHVITLYPWEAYITNHRLDSFTQVRMHDDDSEPDINQVRALAEWIDWCRWDGTTAVLCQAGLNRSGLMCAATLMVGGGLSAGEAIEQLRSKRSPAVLCNKTFENWLRANEDDLQPRVV